MLYWLKKMLVTAFIFLPIIIVLVVSRILGDLLLKDGNRAKITIFGLICVAIYAVLLVLVAQVHE